jgi:predicted metal-dependent hydrolase
VMNMRLKIGDIVVDVVRKDIKNIHLSVYPPTGRVHISAPSRTNPDAIRVFAVSKIGWIKKQQRKLREQERETPREYLDRESHYVWGKRYLLKLLELDEPPSVELQHSQLLLRVRPGAVVKKKQAIVEAWYREQLKNAVRLLISQWEPIIGVEVRRFFVQRMKTRWGGCNPRTHSIRLNTELGKKPRECLEYIIVHEMVHLLESVHNDRFVALMNQFMPKWQFFKGVLNRFPLRHEDWVY